MGSCLSSVRRTTALREEVVGPVTSVALGVLTDLARVESPVFMNVPQPTPQGNDTPSRTISK